MARLMFTCPDCKVDFTHTEAPSDGGVFAYSSIKPVFPDGGIGAVCPNCGKPTVFQRNQPTYRVN